MSVRALEAEIAESARIFREAAQAQRAIREAALRKSIRGTGYKFSRLPGAFHGEHALEVEHADSGVQWYCHTCRVAGL